uniref:Uncharacterized protein n=1 Tax=Strigamia maritima TaxID=126957 RepID=T1ITV9_STRMM
MAFALYRNTESGRDNPFRPDGDLSKEADEIVGLIKEGKPIVGTPTRQDGDVTDNSVGGSPAHLVADGAPNSPVKETMLASKTNAVYANNAKGGVNGAAPTGTLTPEAIEVQRGIVVPPNDPQVVEHVTIQKKPKCKCWGNSNC